MSAYKIRVIFNDGSIWDDEINSEWVAVWPKKGFDYEMVDTRKYNAHWLQYNAENIGITEYKRGFVDWLSKTGQGFKSVLFSKIKE